MSIFSKIGKALKKTVKAVAPIAATGVFGPVGAAIGTAVAARNASRTAQPQMLAAPSFAGQPMQMLGALPGIATRVLPGIGRALTSPAVKRLGRDVGTGIAGAYIYDQLGNVVGRRKKYRRINPLNVRAARRAIRRIKAVRKITNEIERQLPHRKSSGSCAPKRRKC